jgi:phage/plasmid-associated DNA primase
MEEEDEDAFHNSRLLDLLRSCETAPPNNILKSNFISLDENSRKVIHSWYLDTTKFYEKYDELLSSYDYNHCFKFSLLEQCLDIKSPLRFDIDIRKKAVAPYRSNPERLYNEKLIRDIVEFIHKLMHQTCENSNTTIDAKELSCAVIEKSEPTFDGDKIKDGFHLFFPYFIVYNDYQNKFFTDGLRESMIHHMKNDKDWSRSGCEITFDHVGKVANVVMGCRKFATAKSDYRLKYVLDGNRKRIANIGMMLPELKFASSYSINCATTYQVHGRQLTKVLQGDNTSANAMEIQNNYDMITRLGMLEALNPRRTTNYNDWIHLGMLLHSIGAGDDRFKQLWMNCSKREPNRYVDSGSGGNADQMSHDKWRSFKTNYSPSLQRLMNMIRVDNPSEYQRIKGSECATHLEFNIFGEGVAGLRNNEIFTDRIIAEIFGTLYKGTIMSLVIPNAQPTRPTQVRYQWYTFEGHRWILHDDIRHIERMVLDLFALIQMVLNGWVTIHRDERMTNIKHEFDRRVRQHEFLNKVMAALPTYTRNEQPVEFDRKEFLLHCTNGVLELNKLDEDGHVLFRPGVPEDYISLTTDITYPLRSNEEIKALLLEALEQIFPDPQLRQEFIDAMAYTITGICTQKMALVANGEGNAGKSFVVKLMEATVGGYQRKASTALMLRHKVDPGGATPALTHLRKVRLAFIDEMEDKVSVDEATFKRLTGLDTLYTRGMFQEAAEKAMNVNFTLYISANKFINCGDEDAVHIRIYVIKFISHFSYNAPSDKKTQKLHNHYPIRDLPINAMATEFLKILAETYAKHIAEDPNWRPLCPLMKQYANEARMLQNPIEAFVRWLVHNKFIEYNNGGDDFISYQQMHNQFLEYHRKSKYKRDEFEKGITKSLKNAFPNVVEEIECVSGRWNKFSLNVNCQISSNYSSTHNLTPVSVKPMPMEEEEEGGDSGVVGCVPPSIGMELE